MGRLIKQINFPADLRKFKKNDLKQISDELRDELIDVVSETGGHLRSWFRCCRTHSCFALCF